MDGEVQSTLEAQQPFYLNGVDALTGGPLWEPQTIEQVIQLANAEFEAMRPEAREEVRTLSAIKTEKNFGLDVDNPANPAEGRWGVIFAAGEDPEVRQAVQPLIEHRARTLGFRPRIFEVDPDTTAAQFLHENGVERGLGKVALVPYYLLVVGDPRQVSFRLQMELNTEYATGRLHFDSPDGYAAYVEHLLQYEQSESVPTRREAVFWAPERDVDPATSKSAPYMVQPLQDHLPADLQFGRCLFRGSQDGQGVRPATKENLRSILCSPQAPALLFTASHGLGYKKPCPEQLQQHGALLCQEYVWGTPVQRHQWYGGEDLAQDGGNVRGMVHFAFACYGAGTPQHDDYASNQGVADPIIADQPFVSLLPREMLARGMLAFIGHVERAWSNSFMSGQPLHEPDGITPLEAFQRALQRILHGGTVGHALRDQHDRGVHLSSSLLEAISYMRRNHPIAPATLVRRWIERNDARAYMVIGDPAARLRVELMHAGQRGPVSVAGAALPGTTSSVAATAGDAPTGDTATAAPASEASAATEPTTCAPTTLKSDNRPSEARQGPAVPRAPATRLVEPSVHRAIADATVRDRPAPGRASHESQGPGRGRLPTSAAETATVQDESFQPPLVTGRDPQIDHELLLAWKDYIKDGFKQNNLMFQKVLSAFLMPYWLTVGMYMALFVFGLGGFGLSVYLTVQQQVAFAAIFGGLSVAAFLTFFISRPLRSLEQNIVFITWLGIIYNTYWSQLMNTTDPHTVQKDLEAITNTTLKDLHDLIDKQDRVAGQRPNLPSPETESRSQSSR